MNTKMDWFGFFMVTFVIMTIIGIGLSYALHSAPHRPPHLCETPAGRDDPRCVGWFAYDRQFNRH